MSALLQRLKTWFTRAAFDLGRRLKANFFLYLAAAFTFVVVVDALSVNYIAGKRQASYDQMMRLRVNVPAPDPAIVIVDIDERSLAMMAPDYGRWPWPRQVLAEFVERVEAQQPKAIVFDILLSDPDIQNPDSDAYLNEVLAANANVLLPMVRLDAVLDTQSQLRYAQVPGAVPGPTANPDATVAMIVPFLTGAQQPGRLGTNNIEPDSDGVARRYPIRLTDTAAGWTLPGLPLTVAGLDGRGADAPDSIFINWRGTPDTPNTYTRVSFAEVYLDLLREQPTRPAGEFAGKILIIGSTAAGLNDIKGTPIDAKFPGVEILATAIDNLRQGDWIRAPESKWLTVLLALAVIWSTAWAFYRSGAGAKVDKFYGASAIILLGFSYATVNFANFYINLTGPVFIGAIYFSIARLYAFATARALDTSLVARYEAREGELRGLLLALQFPVETREEAALEKLAARIQKRMRHEMSAEILSGRQKGLWRLFENTLVICWAYGAEDETTAAAVRTEADGLLAELDALTREAGVAAALPAARVVVRRTEGRIRGNQPGDWRVLFAAALLQDPNESRAS